MGKSHARNQSENQKSKPTHHSALRRPAPTTGCQLSNSSSCVVLATQQHISHPRHPTPNSTQSPPTTRGGMAHEEEMDPVARYPTSRALGRRIFPEPDPEPQSEQALPPSHYSQPESRPHGGATGQSPVRALLKLSSSQPASLSLSLSLTFYFYFFPFPDPSSLLLLYRNGLV